ncbi:MAG: hypothetical protein Q9227_005084 [Pyrenula ochraceoflavens]
MSSQLKPIKVWGAGGPNPPKVAIIFEELNLPYEVIAIPFSDIKKPDYLAINPNGRLPSIQDPNNDDLILWESGAIVEYLIERYDKDHKLSFAPGTPEAYLAKQWAYFQASGQGPYYGQAAWFKKFHHEQVPSAKERYNKEVDRVSLVLEGWLAQQKEKYGGSGGDGPWLVGNRMSYADLSFVMWQRVIAMILDKDDYDPGKYPNMKEWLGKMETRPGPKRVFEVTMAARH